MVAVAAAAGCNWKAEESLAESLQPRANDHQSMVFPCREDINGNQSVPT